MDIDLTTEALGEDGDGSDVYLRDLWPSTPRCRRRSPARCRRTSSARSTRDVFDGRRALAGAAGPRGRASSPGTTTRPTCGSRRTSRGCRASRSRCADIEGARCLVIARRQRHHRPHLARGLDQAREPGRAVPARARRRAARVQLVRLTARQPRGDGARDLRQRAPAQPARAWKRGLVDCPPARRRGDDDLRCGRALPGRGRPADRARREGVRLGLVARLGGKGAEAARRAGRDRRELRADPPLEPADDGPAAAPVPRRRDPRDARPDGPGGVLDQRARGRRGGRGHGAGGRQGVPRAGPDGHPARARVLPPRRHPGVRAAPGSPQPDPAPCAFSTSPACSPGPTARCCSPTSAQTWSRSSGRAAATRRAAGGLRSRAARRRTSSPSIAASAASRSTLRVRKVGRSSCGLRARRTSSSRTSGQAPRSGSASATRSCSRENPRLVYCSITGFGSERPGYDFVVQAESGLMAITGEADGPPLKVGVAVVDMLAGLRGGDRRSWRALLEREPTGRGARLEISLLDTALSALVNVGQSALVTGTEARRYGNAHSSIVPYQTFAAADGEVAVAAANDGLFARLCAVLERPELAEDERYRTNDRRVEHRDRLRRGAQRRLRRPELGRTRSNCSMQRCPAGKLRGVREALADARTITVEHPTAASYRSSPHPSARRKRRSHRRCWASTHARSSPSSATARTRSPASRVKVWSRFRLSTLGSHYRAKGRAGADGRGEHA